MNPYRAPAPPREEQACQSCGAPRTWDELRDGICHRCYRARREALELPAAGQKTGSFLLGGVLGALGCLPMIGALAFGRTETRKGAVFGFVGRTALILIWVLVLE